MNVRTKNVITSRGIIAEPTTSIEEMTALVGVPIGYLQNAFAGLSETTNLADTETLLQEIYERSVEASASALAAIKEIRTQAQGASVSVPAVLFSARQIDPEAGWTKITLFPRPNCFNSKYVTVMVPPEAYSFVEILKLAADRPLTLESAPYGGWASNDWTLCLTVPELIGAERELLRLADQFESQHKSHYRKTGDYRYFDLSLWARAHALKAREHQYQRIHGRELWPNHVSQEDVNAFQAWREEEQARHGYSGPVLY